MNAAAAFEVKGWCPGALRPMESGDGLLVRIKPWGGAFTVAQTAGLAELATRLGNGQIDLTRQRPEAAAASFERLLQREPSHVAGLNGLAAARIVLCARRAQEGDLDSAQAESDRARELLARAREIAPDYFLLHFNDALLLLLDNDAAAGLAVAGAMLERQTPQDARDCYREHVLAPRRQRMHDILAHGQALRLIDADADIDGAVSVAIGAAYVTQLSGTRSADWPARTAALVWRAVGGTDAAS